MLRPVLHRLRLAALPLLLLGLGTASCGEEPFAPGPLLLAHGGFPAGLRTVERPLVERAPAPAEGWLRLREEIPPEAWEPTPWPGVVSARVSLPGIGHPPGLPGPHELEAPSGPLELLPIDRELLDLTRLEAGAFVVLGDQLLVLDPEGLLVSQELVYHAWFERGAREDGRVHLHDATGDGLLLLPGERIDLDLPAVAAAHGGRAEGAELLLLAAAHGQPGADRSTPLVIELEGRELARLELPNRLAQAPRPHRIALPDFAGGRLSLRVPEGRGLVLVLAPTVAAAPRRSSASAPERPDIVLFLADTFRADNLTAYGGDPRTAPAMNHLAAEGLTFTGARAAAAWTLPSQASLLTGQHPRQHDVRHQTLALPPGLPTLARELQGAGYRTVAVTDGLFVSERHGLDQGFEVFLEQTREKEFEAKTLERVRRVLELDDGRPLFLFVQSYRAHEPFVVSPETLAAQPWRFGERPDPAAWDYTDLVRSGDWSQLLGDTRTRPESVEVIDQLERLYRGGCSDLDLGFEQLRELLAERGLAEAVLVLTSDHGEAFGEHGGWGHGTSAYEEQLAVPLVLSGPGIEPGLRDEPVGLVDLAPTLAGLAGLDPASLPASWVGRDLLAAPPGELEGDVLLAFECEGTPAAAEADDLALYQGTRKVLLRLVDGRLVLEPVAAFDLATDPLELDDQLAPGSDAAPWARQLVGDHVDALEAALRRGAAPQVLELSDAELEELAAMGYLGD